MDTAQHNGSVVLARILNIGPRQVGGQSGAGYLVHESGSLISHGNANRPYPFTAPLVMAPRISRWSDRNATIAGTTEIRQAAASSWMDESVCMPRKLKILTPIGIRLFCVSRRKGTRNCDQPAITVMMKTEAIPGADSGRTIRQKTEKRLHPSIMAASSRLRGIPSTVLFNSHVASGTPR